MLFPKKKQSAKNFFFHRQVGSLGYRIVALKELTNNSSGPTKLEEKQEQLRALEVQLKNLMSDPKYANGHSRICNGVDIREIFRAC
ncbi:MAG: hypothetical protein AB8G05_05175 [Oligoflexales bacterium]